MNTSVASPAAPAAAAPRVINIDLGAPLVECTMQLTVSRLNEAFRVVLTTLNAHEHGLHGLSGRVADLERRQEMMQRELSRIAPAVGASSTELLDQILVLKREVATLSDSTSATTKALDATLGGRLAVAEEYARTSQEQRTRDLIAREKDFTQLTADMQKLATRLGALVIPDVAPLEGAQRSLAKRLDEAERLAAFASAFAAVWDADSARVDAFQRAATADKVEYLHSLPAMKLLRNQMLTNLRTQAVERLDLLTHELRDKVDVHKLTDLLGAVDEQLNELRVEDGRQERRLVSLEHGPLRIASLEDTLRRLQQSKADLSSLDLKADLAALQGLLQSLNAVQDDINDLYDRIPRNGGGGGGNNQTAASTAHGKPGAMNASSRGGGGDTDRDARVSFRPSQSAHMGASGAAQSPAQLAIRAQLENAAIAALERRATEGEVQTKRLDDLKANRSELLRLHEYLDARLQNFSALTSSAVAQANAAASAASRTLQAAARAEAQQQAAANNNNSSNNGDNTPRAGTASSAAVGDAAAGSINPQFGVGQPNARDARSPPGPGVRSRLPLGAAGSASLRQHPTLRPHPPSAAPSDSPAASPQRGGADLNRSVFAQSPHRQDQSLNVAGAHAQGEGAFGHNSPEANAARRSPLPTARIGNSWHIGRSSVAVRDSAGALCGSASIVPKHTEAELREMSRHMPQRCSPSRAPSVVALEGPLAPPPAPPVAAATA